MFLLDQSLFFLPLACPFWGWFFFFGNCRLFLRLGIYTHTHSPPNKHYLLLLFSCFCFMFSFILSLCSTNFPFVPSDCSFSYKHTLHTLLTLRCLCFTCSIYSVLVWHTIPKCPTLLGAPISPVPILLELW